MKIDKQSEEMKNNAPSPLQKIMEIEDEYDLLCELSMYIGEKCDYGYNLAALSEEERIFYITQKLEMEVNNGGFWQYIYNAEEDVYVGTVDAFSAIGARATAALCQNAFCAFGTELPKDREGRIQFVTELGMEKCYKILSEYDDAFYAYEEDLTALNIAYVRKNIAAFS